jgi:hypothetical protein
MAMALGDEVDEIFRREVKSLPAYAKAQAASGSGLAPPVDEMNQLLMSLANAAQRSFSPARRPHRKHAEGLKLLSIVSAAGPTTQAGALRSEPRSKGASDWPFHSSPSGGARAAPSLGARPLIAEADELLGKAVC